MRRASDSDSIPPVYTNETFVLHILEDCSPIYHIDELQILRRTLIVREFIKTYYIDEGVGNVDSQVSAFQHVY